MTRRRVGLLIASLRVGGAERATLGLLDELTSSGFEAFLLTLDRNREMMPATDSRRREELSRRILALSGGNIHAGTLRKSLTAPSQWLRLESAVRRLRLDVVVSIMERANIMNLLRLSPARRVISIRSYPSLLLSSKQPLKRFLVVRLYRLVLRRADRIVFVSKEAASDFERLFPAIRGRGTVIYNACDVDRARRLAREPLPEEFAGLFGKPVVVACGRLNAEKGHWHLLRAFREVCRRDAEARLVLVGSGPLGDDLSRLSEDLGIGARVFFVGFQANPLAWFARSSVFVLPSSWEGFPNSLLEALATGVPVVTSDCRSGPREILAPETDPDRKTDGIEPTPMGFLVPAPDGLRRPAAEAATPAEALLAEAIERALRDTGLRRSCPRAASERLTAFAPDRIIPQWLRLIETVL